MAGNVKVKVREGWAVCVDGEQHGGGAEVDVPADIADHWQAQGWVERVKAPAAKPTTAKRRKRT